MLRSREKVKGCREMGVAISYKEDTLLSVLKPWFQVPDIP
jgi:hypothetical protein